MTAIIHQQHTGDGGILIVATCVPGKIITYPDFGVAGIENRSLLPFYAGLNVLKKLKIGAYSMCFQPLARPVFGELLRSTTGYIKLQMFIARVGGSHEGGSVADSCIAFQIKKPVTNTERSDEFENC